MEKERIKQIAREFCEAYGNGLYNHPGTIELAAKFAASLIEKGVFVDADKYSDMVLNSQNKHIETLEKQIKTYQDIVDRHIHNEKSTVSSAGKEVKTLDECKDIVAVKNGFKDWFHYTALHPIGRLVMNAVCEMYANQFKATLAKEITDSQIEEVPAHG
jgi:hypothetical protein